MGYVLRTREGLMTAKLSARLAAMVMDQTKGFFRDANYKDKGKVRVFEVTEDSVYGDRHIRLYLWKGSTLVPENT